MLIASKEVFREEGYNADLVSGNFDIVIGGYHLGLNFYSFELFTVVLQFKTKTYFLSFWFGNKGKERAKRYFKGNDKFKENDKWLKYDKKIYGLRYEN
jgi:hypothetical protein